MRMKENGNVKTLCLYVFLYLNAPLMRKSEND